MRLRTKFAVVLLVMTLVLGGAVFAGLEFYKQQAVGEVRQNVNETSVIVADQIDATVRERRDYVGLVASRPQAAQFDRSDEYLDAVLLNSRFYAAQIVAANGTVISFRGQVREEVRRRVIGNRTNASYVESAMRKGSHVSDAEYAPRIDQYILVFSAPIIPNAEGDVKGVLVAAIKLNEQTIFSMVPPLETSSQAVTITRGDDVLHGGDRTIDQPVRASTSVESTGWTVSVARDRAQLNERLGQLAIFQGVGLAIVLFSMVGFGYWQYAVSLRQTERLLEGFSELERGNYDRYLSLGGGTEWEQISDGFNQLSDGLRSREEALRERQQRLEVLYRVLRHNLRNEMSVILNYADIVEDFAEDEVIVEAAGTILRAGRSLTGLSQKARQIENALESTEADPEPLEVAGIAEEVAEDVGGEYPEVDLTVSTPGSAWASALPSLRMAIENVCENACKHNDDPDPRVDVTVDAEGSSVRVVVADNGPGIPEQDRNVIAEGRETSLEHGSGLGIWLVFWIVDKSGGELRFDDNDPKGSVVTIELPAASPEEEAPAEPEPAAATTDGAGGSGAPPGDGG